MAKENHNRPLSNEVKKHFLEIISTYNKYQEMIERKSDMSEVCETLGGIIEAARELTLRESDDWFDKHTIKRNMSELDKLGKQFDKLSVEAKNMDQRLISLYEDMGNILSRYYKFGDISEEDMKKRLAIQESVKRKLSEGEGMDMTARRKVYDKLKKGDKIKITYGTSIRKGNQNTFVVTSPHRVVGKQKVGRIILKNLNNPSGTKYFLYNRNGNVGMAVGDMGAVITAMDTVNESINENSKVDKVVKYIKRQIDRGYLQKFEVDEDEIYAAISKLNIRLSDKEFDEVEFELNETVNEATKPNNDAKKILKGFKKIKVNGLGGWMPGVDYVYKDDKTNKYWFVDTDGDAMELKNKGTLAQFKKKFETVNEGIRKDWAEHIEDMVGTFNNAIFGKFDNKSNNNEIRFNFVGSKFAADGIRRELEKQFRNGRVMYGKKGDKYDVVIDVDFYKKNPELRNESKITMNNLDWGKSTAERNSNLDKYKSLKSDKEKDVFLKKLKGESVNEAAHGYKDSTAGYVSNHNDEYKIAEKINKSVKGDEMKFYDELEKLHTKLKHAKYMIWLANSLRGYKVDMYKDPKIKNKAEAEEALYLLSK